MGLLRELRLSLRGLLRRPGFAIAVVGTLALGIGANTAIFSVVEGIVLRPLPYDHPEELVAVWPEMVTNVRVAEALAADAPALGGIAAASIDEFALTDDPDLPAERVTGARVTPGWFDVLGVAPALGRGFRPEESEAGRSAVVVIDHGLWVARYGADPDVIGRTIEVEYTPRTVIGVMPPGHRPLDARVRLWVPQEVEPGSTVESDGTWWMTTRIGRLAPGATPAGAEAQVRAAAVRLAERDPRDLDARGARAATVEPLQEAQVGSLARTLWILLGAVGLVLLIACVNVANLLLARVPLKRWDVAVRTALGASRGQAFRHLLAESLVLGLIGGLAGLGLAAVSLDVLRGAAPASLPGVRDVRIDGAVLAFAFAASSLTALLCGLLPAIRAVGVDIGSVLGAGGRGAVGDTSGGRLRSGLIAAEIAVAVVLAIGATLLARTVGNLLAVDPGFRPDGVLTMQVSVPPMRAEDGSSAGQDLATWRMLWTRLAAVPGVERAGGIHILPLGGGNNRYPFWAEGNEPAAGGSVPAANIRVATPGYLEAMGIGLEEGRWFTDADRFETTPVMVLNRTLATRLWPGRSAVGKRVRLLAEDGIEWTVVGVVSDVSQMALSRDPSGEIYLPHEQWTWGSMFATLRAAAGGRPEALVPAVLRATAEVDPDITVSRVATMEAVVGVSIASNRFLAGLMGAFGILALVLGAIGVYGVVACGVSQRVPEFAVRMALGASGRDLLVATAGRGLLPIAAGILLGVLGALVSARLLTALLFGVAPHDPLTYVAVVSTLIAVAGLAWWVPARRAARVDPMVVLREE